MYTTRDGEEIFIIDGHTHNWDGSPANQKNVHGKQFIDCFYGYHSALSPKEEVWPKEKFDRYGAEQMYQDLFVDGPDDMAILQCTYLTDFYTTGFNTIEQNAILKNKHPDRFILNGAFDPRDEEAGLAALDEMAAKYKLKGVKLYTAEWKGASRGYKLSDPWAYKYLERAEKLGIKNIHVHKGPTIIPLDRDAFDVADIDHCATDFPNLNFIVEHCGLPRLDDFCWIAVQEANVYGGLAVALPFIHARKDYFTNVISELAVLARRGPSAVRQRLRHLDAALAGRAVHGLRAARSGQARQGCRSYAAGQEEDSWPQRRAPLRHRRRRAGTQAARRAGTGGGGMSAPDRLAQARLDQVWERLARVTDPELDESVTELRFVTDVAIDDEGDVAIGFRLPTYWCAANFAFMMADDMRREVASLPWARGVAVRLGEHMYADTINEGLARRISFQESFGADADGDLDALRRTFLVKAFQRRQEALLRHLLAHGHTAAELVSLRLAGLAALALDDAGSRLRSRYLERRDVCACPGEALAFVDADGSPLTAAALDMHLKALARVGINAEFNGAICRGLLAARFGEDAPAAVAGEPTLLDFARMPAAARA